MPAEWRLPPPDHPRSRGEYRGDRLLSGCGGGSSPLSRGIRWISYERTGRARIIPALAGNTPHLLHQVKDKRDHPRSRGEYGGRSPRNSEASGSSPLSRGIPVIDQVTGEILPDHPRSRGEYPHALCIASCMHGSSPLSRGILFIGPKLVVLAGIIPALAGNTSPSTAIQP